MRKTIKVLHTEWSDGWGGQEIRIINEMIALREQGVEIYLACTNHAQIKQKALDNDIKVFLLPFRGNADFKTLFGIKKIIQENQIDIVNTHSGKDTWVGGLAAKLAGVKFIRTRHLSNPIKPSRSNFINELADYIFTTGEGVRLDMITNNRIKPEKIQSIPTGIDADIYDSNNFDRQVCRDLFQFQDGQIVIGIIAVLRQFKRHDRFLNMARNIIDNNSDKDIHFVMAGDGPQRENLSNMINDLGLQDHVSILGHVSNVPELLQALDVFVLTSDSGEGVPQSVMQALLMQTAVVSTNAGSTKDLHHDNNFILIDKDSHKELNEACNKLVNSEDLRNQYARNSRKYVLDNFSKVKMTVKIINIYSSMVRQVSLQSSNTENQFMKSYMSTVISVLNNKKPKTILDAPSGNGWLLPLLSFETIIDGVDLFEETISGYRNIIQEDLDFGIPDSLLKYDAIVSCEGIEHFGNPALFLNTAKKHLNIGGIIIITTPNTWHPSARIQYLLRGFFPGFPCLVGKIHRGTHMHITPWSFPQLYLYLTLAGYTDIKLHNTTDKKPKHFFERIFGFPQKVYCRSKFKKSKSKEEENFWKMSGGSQSIFGRRLVVSASNNG